MKIKVVLTYDDSRQGVGDYDRSYHRNCIGSPLFRIKLLNNCTGDEQVRRCYPFNKEDNYVFTYAFNRRIAKCLVYNDNGNPVEVHDGVNFIDECICNTIEKFKEMVKNRYFQFIHNVLQPGEASCFEYLIDCEKNIVTCDEEIKFVDVCHLNIVRITINGC